MKKIFLFLFVLCSAVAFGQPGYTSIFAKYNWDGGLFKRLGIPAGDSAQFLTGQAQRQGSIYMDTTNTPDSPNGYYIFEDPTGGNAPFWNLQGNQQICLNRLISEWNVSWQGVGFNYSVHGGLTSGQGSYQIGCSFYTADSTTVTFSPADADEDRIDIIYLNATGVHVREGDLSAPGTAVRPTVDADEILLTEVLVAAGATSPTLTTLMVYNENTESAVTNTGTTTNGANATFVFAGALSTNVTNINNNDQVFFTKLPDLSTWNVLGFEGLSLAIRLKAAMATNANIGVALQVGTTTVGTEVIVPLVKTNISSYQQISIPISAFGNIANTNITRVRFRYIRPASNAVFTGFYLDYIYFVDGFSTGPAPQAVFTLNPPIGFAVTPTATQQSPGTWTLTPTGYSSLDNFLSPDGWQNLPEILSAIGTLDGRAKSADGAVVDEEEIFLQTVDATFPGLMTSAMFLKLDSNYYIANAGDGDTLAFPDPDSPNITRIKSLKITGGGTITTTDTTVIFDMTGVGGGGGRFGVSGEDDVAGEDRDFQLGTHSFAITGDDGGDNSASIQTLGDGNLRLVTSALIGDASINMGIGQIILTTPTGLLLIPTSLTVTNSNDPGTTGQFGWDGTYFYICIATNTWRRVSHASW